MLDVASINMVLTILCEESKGIERKRLFLEVWQMVLVTYFGEIREPGVTDVERCFVE